MPDAKFLHSMGVASIIAGVILLVLAHVRKSPTVRRAARRVR